MKKDAERASRDPVFPTALGQVDLLAGTVSRPHETIRLSANEVAVLSVLYSAAPEPVTSADLLVDALGYAPAAESRAAVMCVARLRRKLEPDPKQPITLLSSSQGYTIIVTDVPQQEVAEPSTNTALLGREGDLTAVDAMLQAGARPATVVAPGGMGKTSLAREWARRHGARWVDLFGVTDGEGLLRRFTSALALGRDEGQQALRRRVAGGIPIVLDNAEDLGPDAIAELTGWIDVAGAKVLVTSQGPLGLPGEHRHILAPLDRESTSGLVMAHRRRAGLPDLTDDVIGRLWAAVGGHPLAVVTTASLVDLVETIDDLFDVQVGDGPTHHSSIANGVGRTLDRLDPDVREVLGGLAAFEGEVRVTDATAMLQRPAAVVLSAVARLRAVGIVTVPGAGLEVLPMVRTLLRTRPGAREHDRALVAWLLALTPIPRHLVAVRQHLERGLSLAEGEAKLLLLHRHVNVLYAAGPGGALDSEVDRWIRQLPADLEADGRAERFYYGLWLGRVAVDVGDWSAALDAARSPSVVARGAAQLASLLSLRRDPQAEHWAMVALEVLRNSDVPNGDRVEALTAIGGALAAMGDLRGEELLNEAWRRAGTELPHLRAGVSVMLARRIGGSGALERALADHAVALSVRVDSDIAATEADLACLLLDRGRCDEAWEKLQSAWARSDGSRSLLNSPFVAAAIRMVDQPTRCRWLLDRVDLATWPELHKGLSCVIDADRDGLAGLGTELQHLLRTWMDTGEVAATNRWASVARGLDVVRRRREGGVTP